MSNLAKHIPLNPVEHENELRTIILKHQGSTSGNPTQWVVDACNEAFQRGFGLGFDAGTLAARAPLPPPPKYNVQLPPGHRLNRPEDDANVIDGQTRILGLRKD